MSDSNYEYKVHRRKDGSVEREWFYKQGQFHREGDRPALVWYREDGSVKSEYFYKQGHFHREGDHPAMILYREDGSVKLEEFWKRGQRYTLNKAKPCEGKTVVIDGVKYVLTPAE